MGRFLGLHGVYGSIRGLITGAQPARINLMTYCWEIWLLAGAPLRRAFVVPHHRRAVVVRKETNCSSAEYGFTGSKF